MRKPAPSRGFTDECRTEIQRAVANEATKPIYYESRIAKLALNTAELPKLEAVWPACKRSPA